MSRPFHSNINRDAWSAIRGFVYQVEATILKWLTLGENEILELERGEDIDVIVRDIAHQEVSRELEQVKYREGKLSLNQITVLELLLNHFLHMANNPSHNLLFRFITNTQFVVERPAIFPDGTSGIAMWTQLANEEVDDEDPRVLTLLNHLTDKIETLISKIPTTNPKKREWEDFKGYLEKEGNLIAFIKRFEWCFSVGTESTFGKKIGDRLRVLLGPDEKERFKLVHSRLFLHVFKLLSQSGPKRLDKEGLGAQLQLPELNPGENKLAQVLDKLLESLDVRLSKLESAVSRNQDKIAILLDRYGEFGDLEAVFERLTGSRSYTPPPLLNKGSLRAKKVQEIIGIFQTCSYVGFQSVQGTGKSQLAALVGNQFENCFWLELGAFSEEPGKIGILLEVFLSKVSKVPLSPHGGSWMAEVIHNLPRNTLLVLNDLPRLEKDALPTRILVELVHGLESSSTKLLSTSNHGWTPGFLDMVDMDQCFQYTDFGFSDDEIGEFLVTQGAPRSILDFIPLIAVVSSRNTTIVGSIVRYFKGNNWEGDTEQLIEGLIGTGFSNAILEDTQHLIARSIRDERSRELLYRLSLIHWEIPFEHIKKIAQIPDSIPYPNEKIKDLSGVWIQENNDQSYAISPLAYLIGEKNLSDNTIKNVHLTMANALLSERALNEITASRCMSSFLRGLDFNKAGLVLTLIYESAQLPEQAEYLKKWGYLSFWMQKPIPEGMDLLLKVKIRAEQIRIHKLLGQDFSQVLQILEGYLDSDALSNIQKLLIHLQCSVHQVLVSPLRLLEHFGFILEHPAELREFMSSTLSFQDISGILWTPINNFNSSSEVQEWLSLIERFETVSGVDFFKDSISTAAVSILARRTSSFENSLESLENLAHYFKARGLEVLDSVVTREILVYEIEHAGGFDSALGIIASKSDSYSAPGAKYHLFETMGKMYFDNGSKTDSLPWLKKAIALGCESEYGFVDTLVYLASAISLGEAGESVKLLDRALQLSEGKEELTELDYYKVMGELAIAHWLDGNNESSYGLFTKFVRGLLDYEVTDDKKYWVQLFSWSSHAIGYISAAVAKSNLPERVADGSPYMRPYQGMLSFNTKDQTDLYEPSKKALICALMAEFADGVGQLEKAYFWSLKAFDYVRKHGNLQTFLMVSTLSSQYSLINFKVEEALESYLLFSAVSSHSSGNHEEKFKNLEELDIKELMELKPSESWNVAESLTITFAVVPLFMQLLLRFFEGDENSTDMAMAFRNGLETNQDKASNAVLWLDTIHLTDQILAKSISANELVGLANDYGDEDSRTGLYYICLLGVCYLTDARIFEALLNIIPNLMAILKTTHGVLRNILFPFVKNRSIVALKHGYIGSSSELNSLIEELFNLPFQNRDSVRTVLFKAYEELDLVLPQSRKDWLSQSLT